MTPPARLASIDALPQDRQAAMPRWERWYLIACASAIGYCLAYTLCDYAVWPRLTYFPYERTWKLVAGYPGAVPSNFVGTVLWGLGGAAVAATATAAFCRLRPRSLGPRLHALVGAWTLTAFAYAGLYYAWNLWISAR